MLGSVRLQKAHSGNDLTDQAPPQLVAIIGERHPDDCLMVPVQRKDVLDADKAAPGLDVVNQTVFYLNDSGVWDWAKAHFEAVIKRVREWPVSVPPLHGTRRLEGDVRQA